MKRTIIVLIAAMAILACAVESQADAGSYTATPVTYKIIISKVRMWNETAGQWYTASTGDTIFDITGAEVGCACGSYCTNVDLPDGTYTKMEITMSRTFAIKATVVDTDDDFGGGFGAPWYTTSTTINGSIDCSSLIGNYDLGTAVISPLPAGWTASGLDYMYREYDLPASIVITSGTPRTARINFTIFNAVTFSGLSMVVSCYPKAPVITITQIE